MRRENDRLRQDRSDALNVRSREGLLASEWIARTGKAERELAEAREWIEEAHQVSCGVRSFKVGDNAEVIIHDDACTCGRDALLKAMEVPK
jgi:hypothetical protein